MALNFNGKELADGSVVVALEDGSGNSITSTSNALDVNIKSGSSSGAVADKSAFTYGTTNETPIGGVYQDTSPSLTAGTTGAVRLTANRAMHLNLRDSSGNELGNSNASGLFVRPGDGTNAQSFTAAGEVKASVTQPLPAGTNLIGNIKLVDAGGTNQASVSAAGAVKVDGSAVTQPISAASLPLPSNAAQETGGNLASINGKMSPASAALTQVAGSASSVSLLASNAARKGFVIVNATNKVVYVAFAATATTSAWTVTLQQNAVYEPGPGVYTGAISAISTAGVSGNINVTELS